MKCLLAHKWKIVDKNILPSLLEQSRGELECRGYDVSKKDCIVTYRCEKCGAEKVVRV